MSRRLTAGPTDGTGTSHKKSRVTSDETSRQPGGLVSAGKTRGFPSPSHEGFGFCKVYQICSLLFISSISELSSFRRKFFLHIFVRARETAKEPANAAKSWGTRFAEQPWLAGSGPRIFTG
jgi:hypothetical protein